MPHACPTQDLLTPYAACGHPERFGGCGLYVDTLGALDDVDRMWKLRAPWALRRSVDAQRALWELRTSVDAPGVLGAVICTWTRSPLWSL